MKIVSKNGARLNLPERFLVRFRWGNWYVHPVVEGVVTPAIYNGKDLAIAIARARGAAYTYGVMYNERQQ